MVDGKIKFKIITLGCPLNQSESDIISRRLIESGLMITEDMADIYIINSCVVTQNAASKSRKMARKCKKENPRSIVLLMGCYGEINEQELRENVCEIDYIVGTSNREEIVFVVLDYVKNIDETKLTVNQNNLINNSENNLLRIDYDPGKTRPIVKIQEGCNQSCSFCLVTIARGKPKSRDYIDIKNEVEYYLEKGYKEVILAGTNMGLYGRESKIHIDLTELLYKLANLPYNNYRIRLSSLEPMEIDYNLLNVMAENDRICDYLYLPLQSGSDRILKLMNRNYCTDQFAYLVEYAKNLMPSIGIMTDLIAGFPGETEEDHELTKKFLSKLELSKLHVFMFSPRPKTVAKHMSHQVRPDIKKYRAEDLKNLDKQIAINFNEKFVSEHLSILVESIIESEERGVSVAEGFSENYILVKSYFNESFHNIYENRGKVVDVIGEKAKSWGITAVLKNS